MSKLSIGPGATCATAAKHELKFTNGAAPSLQKAKAYTPPSAPTKRRSGVAIRVWKWRRPVSDALGVVTSSSPVSPRKPWRRLSPSAPSAHTIGLARPSVVVTIGDPRPRTAPHHEVVILGGEPN